MFRLSKNEDLRVAMQLFMIFNICVIFVKCTPIVEKKTFASAQECGMEASPNLIHHNPWLVFVEYFKSYGRTGIRCAATLISSRHAVTAAHCVVKALYIRLVARLGEYNIDTDMDSVDGVVADPVVRIDISDVIAHDKYSASSADDIAILVLARDAPYTDFIRPICLPPATGDVTPTDVFSATGWGRKALTQKYSPVKKIIPLPFWGRQDCQNVYKHLDLSRGVICAGGKPDLDTCRGDSGGPLMLTRGRTELWGVTSTGNVICGTEGSPGIYTSVQEHLGWINDVVSKWEKMIVSTKR